MKHIGLTLIVSVVVLLSAAQERRVDSLDDGMIGIGQEKEGKTYRLRTGEKSTDGGDTGRQAHAIYGITFSRIDLGLVKLVDNGSFTLSGNNRDFRYRPGKTVNFGFDLLQAGFRFDDHFRIFLSGGFDWTYMRLRENIDFRENTTPLDWDIVDRNEINYTKNRLTAAYLRFPLTFEWRSEHYSGIGRLKFAVGPEGGFLLKGTQRFKSEELGKQKFKDNYNLARFRYGAFARVGAGAFGIYTKYYFNDIFENSPDQAGLRNFTFGLMFGF